MSAIQLFAVQAKVSLADYATADTFRKKIDGLGAEIARLRRPGVPALAVFPEEIGAFLSYVDEPAAQTARTSSAAMARIALRHAGALAGVIARHRVWKPAVALLLLRSGSARRVYLEVFSRLAREHDLTVVAGSLLCADNLHGDGASDFLPASSRVFNVSYTFATDGRVLSTTRKVNLVPTVEDALGLSAGSEMDLGPSETPCGPVGTLICYDGFAVPHSAHEPGFCVAARRLSDLGAEILAQPSANPWPWDAPWPWNAGRTLTRSQQWLDEGLYAQLPGLARVRWVVNPQLVGQVHEHRFDGRSYIFHRDADGRVSIAAQAERIDAEEVVMLCSER